MFTKKELETTAESIRQKKEAVLNSKKGSDLDYFRNLQTIVKLEDAVNKQLKNRPPEAKDD